MTASQVSITGWFAYTITCRARHGLPTKPNILSTSKLQPRQSTRDLVSVLTG